MHSNHCYRIRQPQLGCPQCLRPGTEDRQQGGHALGKTGSGQDKPERQGGGGHPAAATAEGLDGGPIQWGSWPRGLCAEEEEG